MTTLLLACILGLLVVAGLIRGGAALLERRTIVRRRVVVNLMDGQALAGVLWARRGALLVLRSVTVMDGTGSTPADGEVVVERSHIAFIQAHGG